MILTKNERGIAALADSKTIFKAKTEKSEGLECQCQSESKAKSLIAYVGKTLL